ncbi:MAG TPA: hypothetical protein VFE78_22060 [Gemmataceae bacterium]|jgi:hypothetical protein|nr:hypothetical protein [Gemmataceae bacterium]
MATGKALTAGQRVQVIDPDDGYYLLEGEVEEVHGDTAFVRFAEDDVEQRFRVGQLRAAPDPPEAAEERD